MVAPGQDPPGRHSNEALLLEALDEFDAVESTPLKLCRPSLQKSQDDIRGSIGDGSRLDLNEEIVSTLKHLGRTGTLQTLGLSNRADVQLAQVEWVERICLAKVNDLVADCGDVLAPFVRVKVLYRMIYR